MSAVLIDSSVVLRAVVERSLPRTIMRAITTAEARFASRLALVECERALLRARRDLRVEPAALARARTDLEDLWRQCEIWELTRAVCTEAKAIAPDSGLRTLDALHLATAVAARRRFPTVRLLTADVRLRDAATTIGVRVVFCP